MFKSIEVQYKSGIFLPELNLHLDSRIPREMGFISHAHADHFGRHKKIFCSTQTAQLLIARYKCDPRRIVSLDFYEPFEIGPFLLKLLPAGHIFGSAMLHVISKTNGASLLYTGDFKLRESYTAETNALIPADTLIMETTFGKPNWIFPGLPEIEGQIKRFALEAFSVGHVPIFLCYSLGKSQELQAILGKASIPSVSHRSVYEMTMACRRAGCKVASGVEFDGLVPDNHALILPPNSAKKILPLIQHCKTAILSGWGLDARAIYRFGTDISIPLSDHADFNELKEAVNLVRPKKVITVHGFTREFASELRRLKYEAWSLQGCDQLELDL